MISCAYLLQIFRSGGTIEIADLGEKILRNATNQTNQTVKFYGRKS